MQTTATVVYEDGVLRPTSPLPLPSGVPLHVTINDALLAPDVNARSSDGPSESERERSERAKRAVLEIIALPLEGPDDGFCGADHDRLLYGKP